MILTPQNFSRAIRRRLRQRGFLVATHRDIAFMGQATSAPLALPTADPNLWFWVSSDTGITKDGSNNMFTTGDWTDRSGLSHDLGGSVATATVWQASQVNGHAAVNFSGSFQTNSGGTTGLNAVHTVYLLLTVPTWVIDKYFYDGGNGNDSAIIMRNGSGNIQTYAGNLGPSVTMTIGAWCIITAVFNGASSTLEVNNHGSGSGSVGSSTPNRVVIGGYGGGNANNATFQLAAAIVSNAANNSTVQAIHKNWLAAYGGLSI